MPASPIRSVVNWCTSSGLSAGAEKVADGTIRHILPITAIGCGLIALAGALTHIVFLEPGIRPYLLPGHLTIISLGIYWYFRRPSRLNLATWLTGTYLCSVIGLYMFIGQHNSAVHFGILIAGAMYLALDRRLLLAQVPVWLGWLGAVSMVWLPQGEGLSALVIAAISAAGGAILRQTRITAVEHLVDLQDQLERTTQEREQAMQRVKEAEKLESLGIMAAGVAHDYNNLLVGVVGGVDLALSAQDQAERKEALDTIKLSADALCGLSEQLLEVAGGRPILRQQVDINRVISDTVKNLSAQPGQPLATPGRLCP